MSDDLVKELRSYPRHYEAAHKAAEEIERLRAENERLLAVAQGDARMLAAYHQWCEMNGCAPSSSDLSAAFAALAEEKK